LTGRFYFNRRRQGVKETSERYRERNTEEETRERQREAERKVSEEKS